MSRHGRFIRDTICDILLSGNPISVKDIMRKLKQVWPHRTEYYIETATYRYVPFLLDIGVLERVGKNEVRVRPELLDIMRQGAEQEKIRFRGVLSVD